MEIDSALKLKKLVRKEEIQDYSSAFPLLEDSKLLSELLADFEMDVANVLNRLIQIIEIPFAHKLPKVQQWIQYMLESSITSDGFSLLGKSDDILSCYNAMICSVLIKSGRSGSSEVKKGIDWILKYQTFDRDCKSSWHGSRAKKYGGCLKQTPCYVGLVKSTIALSDYIIAENSKNDEIQSKFNQGLEYILNQNLYQRRSDGLPIRDYMIKFTYPFNYRTNIVELLSLMKANNRIDDVRCEPALNLLFKKRRKNGAWQANKVYHVKNWIEFDKIKQDGLWLTEYIESNIL